MSKRAWRKAWYWVSWPFKKLGIEWPWRKQMPFPPLPFIQLQQDAFEGLKELDAPQHLISSNPSLSVRLTKPVSVEVQLELALPRPIHLKEGLRVRRQNGPRSPARNRLPNRGEPREVSGPEGISGIQGLETVIPQVALYDDPTRVVEVRNELTGQVWNFKDIGSMTGPDGAFMLRGQWPPGLYRIENRTGASLRLTLWNESHDIKPGETWRFAAHSEIGRQAEMIEKRRLH